MKKKRVFEEVIIGNLYDTTNEANQINSKIIIIEKLFINNDYKIPTEKTITDFNAENGLCRYFFISL